MTHQFSNANAWASWYQATTRRQITEQLDQLLADLDQAVRQRGPTCWSSGKCCRFDSYGHRLYITGLEIAWVLTQVGAPVLKITGRTGVSPVVGRYGRSAAVIERFPTKPQTTSNSPVPLPQLSQNTPLADACPYQVDQTCSIHEVRPMGCRVFFCQAGTEDWQHQLYEDYQGKVQLLHTQHEVAYQYMEWRAGLLEGAMHLDGPDD